MLSAPELIFNEENYRVSHETSQIVNVFFHFKLFDTKENNKKYYITVTISKIDFKVKYT